MKKYVLWLLILSALLLPAAIRAGETGAAQLDRLRAEAGNPDSNVVRVPGESGDEMLYLDKKALEEKGHKVVLGREKVRMAL